MATTEEKIRELAYAIWEQEGRPDGKDVEHYYRAKQIIEQLEASATQLAPPVRPKEIAAPKPPPELPDKKRKGPEGRRSK